MEFLDIVADWSERHDVPFEIGRDDELRWYVNLRFKDSEGWFVSPRVALRHPRKSNQGDAAKAAADFREATNGRLAIAAFTARNARIKFLTKCDPRRNRA